MVGSLYFLVRVPDGVCVFYCRGLSGVPYLGTAISKGVGPHANLGLHLL